MLRTIALVIWSTAMSASAKRQNNPPDRIPGRSEAPPVAHRREAATADGFSSAASAGRRHVIASSDAGTPAPSPSGEGTPASSVGVSTRCLRSRQNICGRRLWPRPCVTRLGTNRQQRGHFSPVAGVTVTTGAAASDLASTCTSDVMNSIGKSSLYLLQQIGQRTFRGNRDVRGQRVADLLALTCAFERGVHDAAQVQQLLPFGVECRVAPCLDLALSAGNSDR